MKTDSKTALPEMPDAQVIAAAQQRPPDLPAAAEGGISPMWRPTPTVRRRVGGDLEYFKRGTLSKELEDKARAQGGLSTQPIRTNQLGNPEGREHQMAGIPPLKDVEGLIQERLYEMAMQPAVRDYLTKLYEDAHRHQTRLHRYRRQPQRNQADLHHRRSHT